MSGLEQFAQIVVPGSARMIATVGDERNALLMVTVQTAGGPFGPAMTLPARRAERRLDALRPAGLR